MKLLHFDDVSRLLPHLELLGQGSTQLSHLQTQALERIGVAPDKFTDRSTQALLDHLQARREAGLCTVRQAAVLEKFGVANPSDILFREVDNQLAQARACSWRDYAEMLPWKKGSLNSVEYIAFLRAVDCGVDKRTAIGLVTEKIRAAGDSPKLWKLATEFDRAFHYVNNHTYDGPDGPTSEKEPEPEYEPDYLEAFVQELALVTIDDEYLEARSEFTCSNRSPAGFLHKVFRPGQSVWVTTNPLSREGLIWTHDGVGQNLAELNHLQHGHAGVWYISNPIDGWQHQVERLAGARNPDGLSFRCTECVTDWRHGVLETDEVPADLWLKALVLLELPILAIYESGKRGQHALFHVGAHSHEEWNALVRPHRAHLIRLGACPGSLTPLRLTRLPNCQRGETGQLQKLLYLAPAADSDSTPICRRPVREDPQAIWERQKRAHRSARCDISHHLQPPTQS